MFTKPKILVSACLGFENCRYDASNIHASTVQALDPFVEFIKVCPEVAIGLPTPRESLRLIEDTDHPRLVESKAGIDWSKKMHAFSNRFISNLPNIHGAILKSRSPSCGTKDVKVYHSHGTSHAIGKGSGLFAQTLLNNYPNIPIEEEGRLTNFQIREAFLYQIFTLAEFEEEVKTIQSLLAFHTKHKYAMMSYQPDVMTKLGRIVANAVAKNIHEDIVKYHNTLQELFQEPPSVGRNINTLTHLYGYFKEELMDAEKKHYMELIADYRANKLPYSVPISMITSWALRFQNTYLLGQSILNPFPKELKDLFDTGK